MSTATLYLPIPRIRAAVKVLLDCPAMEHAVRWHTSNGVQAVGPKYTLDHLSTGQRAMWRVCESIAQGQLLDVAESVDPDSRAAVAAAVTVLLVPAEERAA